MPGSEMAFASRPEPCMPTPMMPKRTRSLAGTGCARSSGTCASSTIALSASRLPATTPPVRINSRREGRLFIWNSFSLLERLDGNFLEEYDVVVAVILQPEIAQSRTRATLRLEAELPLRHGIAFLIVRHLDSVQHHDRAWTIQRDLHRVQLRPRFPCLRQRFSQRVEHAGGVGIVFGRSGALRVIIDLYLVTIVHRHPLFPGLERNADEDTGVVIFIAHPVDHAHHAIADRAAGPVEQAHAAVRLDDPVFHRHVAGTHVLPADQVFAVEYLSPLSWVASTGIPGVRRKRYPGQTGGQAKAAGQPSHVEIPPHNLIQSHELYYGRVSGSRG